MVIDNNYIIKIVREDLEYLKSNWNQDIDDASIRISNTILRKLLVEDNLGKVWRLLGYEKEPIIKAPDLNKFIKGAPKLRINFASAGGAIYKGNIVEGMVIYDTAMSDNYIKRRYERNKNCNFLSEFSLSQFKESPCLLVTKRYNFGIQQEEIKRRELIQYVANKLGGSHIDISRNYKKDEKFILLDQILGTLNIGDKESIYYELLSIGQHLVNSPDIKKLIS
ncbi:hypothetical protein [Thermoanaerobacterium thermosaccharolyticum]|uniref:hypothetical protein n=1 Tax=Thermoanaerobacterium thermosaccharolyticum TaxID=1517 RepID=UPI003D2B0009